MKLARIVVSAQVAGVKLQDASGRIVSGQLEYSVVRLWRMRSSVDGLADMRCEESDLFACMIKLRCELQKHRWLLLCQGACKDVYPSAMSRDMGGALFAYRHRHGYSPTRSDVVKIVDDAPPELIGTFEEQQQYRAAWLQSLT